MLNKAPKCALFSVSVMWPICALWFRPRFFLHQKMYGNKYKITQNKRKEFKNSYIYNVSASRNTFAEMLQI